MAIDTTIHRDAEGRAMLTVEQAEALARCDVPPYGSEEDRQFRWDLERDHGNGAVTSLARWVLRWAPVCRAAEALSDPPRLNSDSGVREVWDVVAAVRAARGEGEAT